MAPVRKRSVNNRFVNEVSPENKIVKKPSKQNVQVTGKKKFDKLGPRWSEAELQRFYKAFRVHGMDWKEVAAEVPQRTVEMVHALYKMNKAYLSLPEGTASVVGLIAMMTDHYSTLELSESDRESDDVPEIPRKPPKRRRVQNQAVSSQEGLLQSHSSGSKDGYLSFLKKAPFNGDRPRAVGKRTPRVPISRENHDLLRMNGQKLEYDKTDDKVAHVAALALTEALQKGGSPHVSHPPQRRIENDAGPLADMEGVGAIEVHQKGNKFHGQKVKVEEIPKCQSDDGREACSGTEEGAKASSVKGNVDINVSNMKIGRTPHARKKRRDKFSRDEFSALDALHTLAHLSTIESESPDQLNKDRPVVKVDQKSGISQTTSATNGRERIKPSACKVKVPHGVGKVQGTTARKAKGGRHSAVHPKLISGPKQQPESVYSDTNTLKRKRVLTSKATSAEAPINSYSKSQVDETMDDEEIISQRKEKKTCQVSSLSKQDEEVGALEGSFTDDQRRSASVAAVSMPEVPVASQNALPIRKTSRRKRDLKRAFSTKEGVSPESITKTQSNQSSISGQERTLSPKERLSSCLSSRLVRRWCACEWFYSAIDYPWFAKRDFVEYLNHVGLGHTPKLTRVERGVIKCSLGKPRRFSEYFLTSEIQKLEQYRDSVRNHYTEFRMGIKEALPTDLAKPLSVGQRVIAMHPKTRELHDGSVLTVDHDRCRIQFDCPEMGVEIVKDVDCMPSNPFNNMPEALGTLENSVMPVELQANGHSNIGRLDSTKQVENSQAPTHTSAKASSASLNLRQHDPCPGKTLLPWQKHPVNFSLPSCLPISHQDPESTVIEIFRSSRHKAQTMIDAAIQAISSVKEGEDAFTKVEEALDYLDGRQVGLEPKVQVIRPPEHCNGILPHDNWLASSASELHASSAAPDPKSHDSSDKSEATIPREQIISSVAALLMIQTCAEEQYPFSVAANIIDSATHSLQPCCSQNESLYQEIKICMGRIKNQIIGVVPAQI